MLGILMLGNWNRHPFNVSEQFARIAAESHIVDARWKWFLQHLFDHCAGWDSRQNIGVFVVQGKLKADRLTLVFVSSRSASSRPT